jgi:hypothetical protein
MWNKVGFGCCLGSRIWQTCDYLLLFFQICLNGFVSLLVKHDEFLVTWTQVFLVDPGCQTMNSRCLVASWVGGHPQIDPSLDTSLPQAIERGDKLEAKAKEDAERMTQRLEQLGPGGSPEIDRLFTMFTRFPARIPRWAKKNKYLLLIGFT